LGEKRLIGLTLHRFSGGGGEVEGGVALRSLLGSQHVVDSLGVENGSALSIPSFSPLLLLTLQTSE
jgi:hypothetical protein